MSNMRVLVISDEIRSMVDDVVKYCEQQENWYDPRDKKPGWINRLPGNNKNMTCEIPDGYRCVFSFTIHPSGVYRHLSISAPTEGLYPHPQAVYEIAKLFKFTERDGHVAPPFPDGWLVHMHPGDHINDQCVVVAQLTDLQP